MSDIKENDTYEPVEPNYYSFKGLEQLYQNYDEYLETNDTNNIEKINLCVYQVVNDGKYPFLQFLLMNKFNNLSFISIDNNKYIDNSKLLDLCKNCLTSCLLINNNIMLYKQSTDENTSETLNKSIEQNDEQNIDYKGFYVSNNELFVFFDITKYKLLLNDISRDNILWFVLVDEIINGGMLSGIPIDNNVCEFFILNHQFGLLHNNKNKKYEVPSVAYTITSEKQANFTYIFGVSSSNTNNNIQPIFGSYYYFTNYDNCLTQIKTMVDNNMKESKLGLNRFALFLEKIKLVQNVETDVIDESDIKREKLQDEGCDVQFERLTMRITDYDGKWTENYDSIILTNIRLDNGTLMKNTPILCVKQYEQQYPLSYHFISKSQVKNNCISIM